MVLRHSTQVILLSLCAYGLLVVLGTDGERPGGGVSAVLGLSTAFHYSWDSCTAIPSYMYETYARPVVDRLVISVLLRVLYTWTGRRWPY